MDYFEIDLLDVETDKSGDAITLRYEKDGEIFIHVVDGGFQQTGESVVAHINNHYDNPQFIDHVVATHPDGDHLGGLREVLTEFSVGTLWMLRPWLYADQLIEHFPTYNSVEALQRRLKSIYPNVAALEKIAYEQEIPIGEPFQGEKIGAFTVLSPTPELFVKMLLASEKTPETVEAGQETAGDKLGKMLREALKGVVKFAAAAWGAETFSDQETSSENEMSVVQYAELAGKKIMLTGDAGRQALADVVAYAPHAGLQLPGLDRFQVPHHGSRRNVSSELLDELLGSRHAAQGAKPHFTAIISSAKADTHHPRKSVVRAMMHRGASVISTEGKTVCMSSDHAPPRGWQPVTPYSYPTDQES